MTHSNDHNPRNEHDELLNNSNEHNNETAGRYSDDYSRQEQTSYEQPTDQKETVDEPTHSYQQTGNQEGTEKKADPFIPISDEQYEKEKRRNKKTKSKGFLSTIAAGVIGSVLTLSIIPFTDYPDMFQNDQNGSSTNQSSEQTSAPVKVSKTSATTTPVADMVEKASPAIVGIVNMQKQQSNGFDSLFPGSQQESTQSGEDVESGSGSGVIFKKDSNYAYIVTNNHVIEGANKLEVSLENGKKVDGQLIGADALSDLAVLKIPAKYASSVLEFADSSTLRAGDEVIAIGNPLGLDLSRTVTQGIVSAVNRSVSVNTSAGEWNLKVIQTDAAINPGNSGGALLNTSGQVVGINSLKISENGVEGLGFAIPSNELVPIVNEIINTGKVERVYLGVGLASIDEIPDMYLQTLPKSVDSGVIVTNVDQNSAAYKAGIKVQDVIVSINGTKVSNSTDLREYMYSKLKVGDSATLKLYRDGKLKTVNVKLTSNASSSSN
ncbi:S1C family serine protease [Bacillus sp. 1P06AnD]|uniref:S1C family serine protease n=1 Tax=Bacillus sp. 1P06AnD TaxID=3132208 RepID=UPI0039A18D7F